MKSNLNSAIESGNIYLVREALEAGEKFVVDPEGHHNDSLSHAIYTGDPEIVKLLLEEGSPIITAATHPNCNTLSRAKYHIAASRLEPTSIFPSLITLKQREQVATLISEEIENRKIARKIANQKEIEALEEYVHETETLGKWMDDPISIIEQMLSETTPSTKPSIEKDNTIELDRKKKSSCCLIL